MVYHGRDPAFDAPPRIPGQASKETSPLPFPFILSVGSLLPYRRAEDIIEAFSAHLSPLIPNLHLVFAGDSNEGAYKAYLRQKVRESADPDKIRFLGNVPPQSLPALYRGAMCYVASSEIEACPNSVIEALASSCPIVAGKTPPLPEILGDSAIFYEPRNVSELGSAIGKVVTDSRLGASLSQSSWERARHFSWDACAKSTAKALLDW
jgi:glycosyltransferase involved in cell wall biosynthesis